MKTQKANKVERATKVATWAVNNSKWSIGLGGEFIEKAKDGTLSEDVLTSFESGMENLEERANAS